MMLYQSELCYSVHLWHLNVGKYNFIAHITARFGHAVVVHFDCNEPIHSLIAYFTKLGLNHCFKRHQVENQVIDEENLSLAAASILVFTILFFFNQTV